MRLNSKQFIIEVPIFNSCTFIKMIKKKNIQCHLIKKGFKLQNKITCPTFYFSFLLIKNHLIYSNDRSFFFPFF